MQLAKRHEKPCRVCYTEAGVERSEHSREPMVKSGRVFRPWFEELTRLVYTDP